MNETQRKIEALLYANGGEIKKDTLARTLGVTAEQLEADCATLREQLNGHGLTLVLTDTMVSLRTAPDESEFLQEQEQEQLQGDIGQAGLEVLAIVLYRKSASRSDIDYIRGVNSAHTLRHLVMRGLLERSRHQDDTRQWVYVPTPDLLAHLGAQSPEELPDYADLSRALRTPDEQQAASPVSEEGHEGSERLET